MLTDANKPAAILLNITEWCGHLICQRLSGNTAMPITIAWQHSLFCCCFWSGALKLIPRCIVYKIKQ